MKKEKREKDLICRAKKQHKSKYLYNGVFKRGRREFFNAFCCLHGDFSPEVHNHIRGSGCPACSKNKKLTTDEKIKRVHGKFRGVCKVTEANKNVVTLFCNKHRETHICSFGSLINTTSKCPCTSPTRRLNPESLQEMVNLAQKTPVDLSEFSFTNNKTKSTATCKVCQTSFQTSANNLLRGRGCPTCYGTPKKSKEEVQNLVNSRHGSGSIEILCRSFTRKQYWAARCLVCGHQWESSQWSISNKTGCKPCSVTKSSGLISIDKYDSDLYYEDCILYVLHFKNKETGFMFRKIGVTTQGIRKRFKKYFQHYEIRVIDQYQGNTRGCYLAEQILKELEPRPYRIKDFKKYNLAGWTECYEL